MNYVEAARFLLCATSVAAATTCGSANAAPGAPGQEEASPQQVARAVGHYARARSFILSAIREFDEGRKTAEPSTLMNPDSWRSSLADRARDLERVLDPQPRITSEGVKFQGDPRMLGKPPGEEILQKPKD
jgi:hypothetical protein